jgi:hypothetical protein
MSAAAAQLATPKVPSKLTRAQVSIAAKFRRWQKTKARAKALYDRSDRQLVELAGKLKLGELTPINTEGKHIVLLDNFVGKDLVWGHGGVRRWDLEVVDLSK